MSERGDLEPCPFCGGRADICHAPQMIVTEDESGNGLKEVANPEAGAMFVCCNKCWACSALIYPLMDDVRKELIEMWNRRTNTVKCPICNQEHTNELCPFV